jgi:hypothetical protein
MSELVGEIQHIAKIVVVTGSPHMNKYNAFQQQVHHTVNFLIRQTVVLNMGIVMAANRRMSYILSCVGEGVPPPARLPHAAPLIPLVPHWDLAPNIQICQHQALFVKDQSATVASGANVVNLILSAAQTFAI